MLLVRANMVVSGRPRDFSDNTGGLYYQEMLVWRKIFLIILLKYYILND